MSRPIATIGDVVPVGKIVFLILESGEKLPEISAVQALDEDISTKNEKAAKVEKKEQGTVTGKREKSSPLAKKLARKHVIYLTLIEGLGAGSRITQEDEQSVIEAKQKPEYEESLSGKRWLK